MNKNLSVVFFVLASILLPGRIGWAAADDAAALGALRCEYQDQRSKVVAKNAG
ncbi:MAG: hypothetical protein MK171_02780 [Pirellulales bacterium]|nr:hypothetical protein [Pirellulales bacterium]